MPIQHLSYHWTHGSELAQYKTCIKGSFTQEEVGLFDNVGFIMEGKKLIWYL
jgi:hypothetical protein